MADPLLTSLCGICHTQPPKYKCPRCGARTCSLPCTKKHKNWSSCNGERDPTVFVPAARLRTDAGIDHDYNFLTKIERSVERVGKYLTEERGVLPEQPPAQPPNKRPRLHKGQSRGRRTIGKDTRPWARPALKRCQDLGISVMHLPYGMNRAKENSTSFNKRTETINWQVEWLLLKSSSNSGNTRPKPTRFLHKTLDSTPLHIAFAGCLEKQRKLQLSHNEKQWEKLQAKKARHMEQAAATSDTPAEGDNREDIRQAAQKWSSATWRSAPRAMQDASTGAWRLLRDKDRYCFYLHVTGTPSRERQKLIPLEPDATLESVLPGLEVLEFPTIYVLSAGAELPKEYVLQERPRQESRKSSQHAKGESRKRKADTLVGYGSDSSSTSSSDSEPDASEEEGEIVEEGKVVEDGAARESDPGFEFSGDEQRIGISGGGDSTRSSSSEFEIDVE